MSKSTLQARINAKKVMFLQTLKEQGEFIEYCPQRGYIYELAKSVFGNVTRLRVALKNGALEILYMANDKGIIL